ncbi:winged helix-turn-helix transcriptional regulator [Streptomyces mirabilis]
MTRSHGTPAPRATSSLLGCASWSGRAVLEKVPHQERPLRYEYRPTQAGRDLQPVLVLLGQWGDRHLAK